MRAWTEREVFRIIVAHNALILLHIALLGNESRRQLQRNRGGYGIRRHWCMDLYGLLGLLGLLGRDNDARVHRHPSIKPAEPGTRALVIANPHPRAMRVVPLVIHAAVLIARHGKNNVGL